MIIFVYKSKLFNNLHIGPLKEMNGNVEFSLTSITIQKQVFYNLSFKIHIKKTLNTNIYCNALRWMKQLPRALLR